MAYVIYNKATTKFLRITKNGYAQDAQFATEAAAKAHITRTIKKNPAFVATDWAIASMQDFAKIEKTVVVKNLMSGKDVVQSVNTPRSCDVSSEAYWSL